MGSIEKHDSETHLTLGSMHSIRSRACDKHNGFAPSDISVRSMGANAA